MKKRKYPNAIRNKALADIMQEESEGMYFSYELQDMLDLFTRTVERLISDGEVVELHNFGIFRPKHNKSKKMYSALFDYHLETAPSTTMTFSASWNLQKRLKDASREKIEQVANTKEKE